MYSSNKEMIKNMRHFVWVISTLFFLSGCNNQKKEDPSKSKGQPPVLVDVMIAGADTLSNQIAVNGTVLSNESVEIHPEMSGRITFLNLPDGASVKQGTVLVKINDAELQAQLLKSSSQLSLAEKNETRLKKLLAINGVNQADYDVALNNVNNIKADIQLLLAQIEKTIIKAPFDGVLGLRMISMGAYVTPQTIITNLHQTDKVKIDFTAPDIYGASVKKGAAIKIISEGNEFMANIIAVDPEVNSTSRNIKARAVLHQSNTCRPGSFVKVLLDAGSEKNRILVPTNAIIPDATSKKIILVKDGKGAFVKIKTGVRTPEFVEITEGVSVGDTIVIKGVLFVKKDAAVKINAVKSIRN